MGYYAFDKLASEYDAWFIENRAILESEAALVASTLQGEIGRTLSVGCGSGLFEHILKEQYGIVITDGVEPAEGMANIARQRGMNVEVAMIEQVELGEQTFDTILFNGCPCYISDLEASLLKAHRALRPGGRIIVIDVPKESAFGIVYNLAMTLGTWDHPLLEGVAPKDPYPIELVKSAAWRTTAEKIELLEKSGFCNLEFSQTLTTLPHFAYLESEQPVAGYHKGSYVAIVARKA